jgi:Glycosyl transferase family 2
LLFLEVTFFIVAFIQIAFFATLLIAFLRKRNMIIDVDKPIPISIIVCAHDEHQNLQELLPLLLTQAYDQFEVLIVNDRSNDGTLDWLLAETKKHERLKMVNVEHKPEHINGKKYGITLAVRAAQYEWLVFTDADCRPASAQWLKAMSNSFSESTQFVLGVSSYSKQKSWLNLFIRFEAVVTAFQYIGFALCQLPYMGVGRNLCYRKSLFMNTKGFSDVLSITGGDDDLFVNKHANKTNTQVAIAPEALVHSIPKITWGDFFQQKIRHLAVGKKYKFKHRFLLGIIMLSWVFVWPLGIALLVASKLLLTVAAILLARVILGTVSLHIATKHWGEKFESAYFIGLDIIYSIYYLTTGSVALVTKKIRWKS